MSDTVLARLDARARGESTIYGWMSDCEAAAAEIRRLEAKVEELEALDWQPIECAPRDGSKITVRYDDGTQEDNVIWAETRHCMLGPRAGEIGPGWFSTEIALPVGNDPYITHWHPHIRAREQAAARRMQERCAEVCNSYSRYLIEMRDKKTDRQDRMRFEDAASRLRETAKNIRALTPETP